MKMRKLRNTSVWLIICMITVLFGFTSSAVAQWQLQDGTTNIYYNSGNVGIGTTTPTAPLDVNGNIRVKKANREGIYFGDSKVLVWRGYGSGTPAIASDSLVVGMDDAVSEIYWDTYFDGAWAYCEGTAESGIIVNCADYSMMDSDDYFWVFKHGNPPAESWCTGDCLTRRKDLKIVFDGESNDGVMGYMEDEDAFYFTGKLGIGTTNPSGKLTIAGGNLLVNANDGSIILDSTGADLSIGATQIGTTTPHDFFLRSNATDRIMIGANGNIGIGTIDPNAKLDVAGNIRGTELCIGIDCRTSWPVSQNSSSGNVGIGTTQPSSLLEIAGQNSFADLRLTRTNDVDPGSEMGQITFRALNGSEILNWAQLRVIVESATAPYESAGLAFNTRNADGSFPERVRIAGNGNVGIGTATPDSKLHVAGNAHVTENLQVDGNIAAKYQDLAEYVRTSESLTSGMVVMIDTKEVNQVVPSDKAYNTLVAGVVSETPGIILGEGGADKAIIAHTGRVKVKVDTNSGEISAGDLLVTSPVKGYAMKADSDKLKPGMLLGKALEPLKEGQKGEILVLITLQ